MDTEKINKTLANVNKDTSVVVAIGMIGIGCTVNYKDLLKNFRSPKALIVGVVMQLVLVPLVAWALAKMFRMVMFEALGVMIQGCSPGGTTSNLVVYWIDGIVDLSVAMTATTTLLALGTMPLWLFIFSKAEQGIAFNVPFAEIGISLASLVLPLALGIILNWKYPKAARIISRVLITIASVGLLVLLVVISVLRRSLFRVSWQQVAVSCIMPLLTLAIAYLITLLPFLKLHPKQKRTLALEIILFPLLYYVFQVSYAALLAGVVILGRKMGWIKGEAMPNLDDEEPDSASTQPPLSKHGEDNPTFVENENVKENAV